MDVVVDCPKVSEGGVDRWYLKVMDVHLPSKKPGIY
jgi:hypothetical protein